MSSPQSHSIPKPWVFRSLEVDTVMVTLSWKALSRGETGGSLTLCACTPEQDISTEPEPAEASKTFTTEEGVGLWCKGESRETGYYLWPELEAVHSHRKGLMPCCHLENSLSDGVHRNAPWTLFFSGMCLQASCVERTQGSPSATLSQKQIHIAGRTRRFQPPPASCFHVLRSLEQTSRRDFSSNAPDSKLGHRYRPT